MVGTEEGGEGAGSVELEAAAVGVVEAGWWAEEVGRPEVWVVSMANADRVRVAWRQARKADLRRATAW